MIDTCVSKGSWLLSLLMRKCQNPTWIQILTEFEPKMETQFDQMIQGNLDDDYTYVQGKGRGRYICDSCGTRCQKIWYCFPLLMHKFHFSKICIREISCRKVSFKKIVLNTAYVIVLGKILKFLQKWIELTWLQ